MKKYSFLFLFFMVGTLGGSTSLIAQTTTDSTAFHYRALSNPQSARQSKAAFRYFEKNIIRHLKEKDTLPAIQDLRRIAIGQFELGYLEASEGTAVRALTLATALKENPATREAKKGILNHIGLIYRRWRNEEKALIFYTKALAFAEDVDDRNAIQNNVANIYSDMGNFEKAIQLFEDVYTKSLLSADTSRITKALDNLGYIKTKVADTSGLSQMKEALQLRLASYDAIGTYTSYHHLSVYYNTQGQTEQALGYAEKAYEIAQSINSATYREDALSLLMKLSTDPKVREFQHLSDSLLLVEQEQQNKYAAIKYNVAQEQARTQQAELKLEKEKVLKVMYLSFGVILMVLAILTYGLIRARHKKEKLQEMYKTESRISKKVHDEVANDVYQVMTKIQGGTATSESLLDDLESIYTKTRDISKENSHIDVSRNFEATLNDLLLSYRSTNVSITTRNSSKIPWKEVSEAKKNTLYRVLQELMTNMRKHSNASWVLVTFQQEGTKIVITYSDNGRGCELKKHNGLQNAENRIHTVKGTLIFESEKEKGFKATITL